MLDSVHVRLSAATNDTLCGPFTADVVKKAIFGIGNLKALGLDGLYAVFYKRFLHLLGDDLVEEILDAINTRSNPEGLNEATIVMIPKVKPPKRVIQFSPISLCDVVYKVI
jgi:hypothetical protein